jgi:hypothetical protein
VRAGSFSTLLSYDFSTVSFWKLYVTSHVGLPSLWANLARSMVEEWTVRRDGWAEWRLRGAKEVGDI